MRSMSETPYSGSPAANEPFTNTEVRRCPIRTYDATACITTPWANAHTGRRGVCDVRSMKSAMREATTAFRGGDASVTGLGGVLVAIEVLNVTTGLSLASAPPRGVYQNLACTPSQAREPGPKPARSGGQKGRYVP